MENLSNYELMVIIHPGLGEAKTTEELDEIRKLITTNGGEIFHEDIWGLRDLAYKISKESEGYYVVLNFRIEPVKISILEKTLSIQNAVIRFIVIKTPHDYEIKTLDEYQEEAAKEKAEEKKDEKAKDSRKEKPKKIASRPPKKEVEENDKPAAKTVKKEEKPVEKEKKKTEKSNENLDEVDNKLKSIIDDPDMVL